MATLYEYLNTGGNSGTDATGAKWTSQTFTPVTSHTITSVKLSIARVSNPGTVTVSIRATSGGKPTGGDLVSGTTDGDTLTVWTTYGWREITLGAGYDLDASTQYAIVVRVLGGDASNKIFWEIRSNGAGYTGGTWVYSTNSGSSWTTVSNDDHLFEDWGEAAGWTGKISGVTNPAKIMGVDVANIAKVNGVA